MLKKQFDPGSFNCRRSHSTQEKIRYILKSVVLRLYSGVGWVAKPTVTIKGHKEILFFAKIAQ